MPGPLRERVRRFAAEYGAVGLGVYLVIHLGTFLGAWAAIRGGWRPAGAAGTASTVMMAYVLTSLTKVPRFAATAAVTPLVVRGWARLRGRSAPVPAAPAAPPNGRLPGGEAAR